MRPQKTKPELSIDDRVAAAERSLAAAALYGPGVAEAALDLVDARLMSDDAARGAWEGMATSWADRGHVSELDLMARGLTTDHIRPIREFREAALMAEPQELIRGVQAMHAIRTVAELCRTQAEHAAEQSSELAAMRGWVGDMVMALESTLDAITVREEFQNAREAFYEWVEAQRDTDRAWRATWGVKSLDTALGGLQPGTLHVPIGLPAHGKSALACTAAVATAQQGRRVLYVSREMRSRELGARFAAISNGETRNNLEDAVKDGVDMTDFGDFISERIVPDDRSRTMADVRAKVRIAAAQGDPFHLVVLDYIQLFRGPGDGTVDMLTNLIYGAKDMAMDLEVAVIALAQVNRSNQGDVAPTMRQIKGASAIEDAADSVVSIFKGAEANGSVGIQWYSYDINVEKARNGQAGPLISHRLGAGTFRVHLAPEHEVAVQVQATGSYAQVIEPTAEELAELR